VSFCYYVCLSISVPGSLVNALATVSPDGSSSIVWIPAGDCSANGKPITLTVSWGWSTNGGPAPTMSAPYTSVVSSSGEAISPGGNTIGYGYEVAEVGGVSYQNIQVIMNVTIGPAEGDNAVISSYQEVFVWGQDIPPGSPNYTATTNPPCDLNSSMPYQSLSTFSLNYTNNSASTQVIKTTDGQTFTVPPGGVQPMTIAYPNGGSGGYTAQNQDAYTGQYNNNDTGIFSISNNYGYDTTTGSWTNNQGAIITANDVTNGSWSAAALANGVGGPINWGSSPVFAPSNAANNATLEAGFNDLGEIAGVNGAQENSNLMTLSKQLSNGIPIDSFPTNIPLTINLPTNISAGASNVWVMNWPSNFDSGSSTNGGGLASNVWVQNWPLTNGESASNALSEMDGQTNLAYAVVSPLAGPIATVQGGVPSTLADNTGGADEQDVTLGAGSMQITLAFLTGLPSQVASSFTSLRSFVAWVTILLLVLWNFKTLFDAIQNVLHTQGAQGPDTGTVASAIGGNVATALAVATAIIALVSVLPVAAVAIIGPELSAWSDYTGPGSFFTGPGYTWLSTYVPIWVLVTAVGSRIAFYFALRVLEMIFAGVVKMLIGV